MIQFCQEQNVKALQSIGKCSGSKRVKSTVSYLGFAQYYSKLFWAERYEDIAFYAGTFAKHHFNLLELAVKEDEQGNGVGRAVVHRMKTVCKNRGIHVIRLRTAIDETAIEFWLKQGAEIVGLKNEDYVLEIKA